MFTRFANAVGSSRQIRACAAAVAALLLTGCVSVDLKRLTYELLAQEDCVRNQLDDFCARSYANEYHEYERLRQDYLRGLEGSKDP